MSGYKQNLCIVLNDLNKQIQATLHTITKTQEVQVLIPTLQLPLAIEV
jgi:hypothetical protein